MSEPISSAVGVKATAVTLAGLVATQTAVTVIEHVERSIVGIPQSVLLAAIVGTLIGVFILPNKDAAAVFEKQANGARWFATALLKAGFLGVGVIGFAFLDGWTVTALSLWFSDKVGPAALPCAGILGVFIRPLLPKYMQGLEGVADRLFGRIQ